jgi:zinc-binding alcohol dehydrogenase/oxidoreductase
MKDESGKKRIAQRRRAKQFASFVSFFLCFPPSSFILSPMHALVLEAANQPLQLKEVADPLPGPGEAVVAIQAAALNHRDLWIQKGQYAGLKFPIIPGSDGCGRVVDCGEGVDGFWKGQQVIINPGLDWGDRAEVQAGKFRILGLPDDGTFAERVRVPASQLFHQPSHLDIQHAAALPLAGLTAYRALFSRAKLQSGEQVLVTGVGGGAALFALQFAVAAGASVFITSGSDEKLRRAVELGATGGANYKKSDWADQLKTQAAGEFDVIIDSAGGEGFAQLIDLAAPGGRIAFFGATAGNPTGFDMRRVFWKQLSILGTTMGSPSDFAAMVRFVEDHRLVPLAEKSFPLREGNAALATMEAAEQFGKIVLTT